MALGKQLRGEYQRGAVCLPFDALPQIAAADGSGKTAESALMVAAIAMCDTYNWRSSNRLSGIVALRKDGADLVSQLQRADRDLVLKSREEMLNISLRRFDKINSPTKPD